MVMSFITPVTRGDVICVKNTDDIGSDYRYDPWGCSLDSLTGDLQPFRYAGYYYDEETGLYYLKSRYYSPMLGRFLTRDGYGFVKNEDPQTINLYAYCRNNPVNGSDPNGNDWKDFWENVVQYNSPLGNWIEGYTGKTLITGQELIEEEKQQRIEAGCNILEEGLMFFGTGPRTVKYY